MAIKLFAFVSFLAFLALSGCASTNPALTAEKPSGTPSFDPSVEAAGSYRVEGYVDRLRDEFVVRVLDRQEQPLWVVAPCIKAEVIHSDGKVENVRIQAADYTDSPLSEHATVPPVYRKWFDWLKRPYDVDIKIWLPLPDQKTHELTFHAESNAPVPANVG